MLNKVAPCVFMRPYNVGRFPNVQLNRKSPFRWLSGGSEIPIDWGSAGKWGNAPDLSRDVPMPWQESREIFSDLMWTNNDDNIYVGVLNLNKNSQQNNYVNTTGRLAGWHI